MRCRSTLIAAALGTVLIGGLLDVPATPVAPVHQPVTSTAEEPGPDPDDPNTWQTSDRVPGEIAPPATFLRLRTRHKRLEKTRLARGVRLERWRDRSSRGRVDYQVILLKWKRRHIKVDYAAPNKVSKTKRIKGMLKRKRRVVAGVNGDFFDIGDTGAPLGLGRKYAARTHKHGIDVGWNRALWFDKRGKPTVGELTMAGAISGHPNLRVTNHNSPQVKPGGIGIYDKRWGRTSGFRWTDGQKDDVRMVHVVDGVVTENRGRGFPRDTSIDGYYLIARGAVPTAQLKELSVGTPVRVSTSLPDGVRTVITGNRILLADGAVLERDDTEMHPRTAIGIDWDDKLLILITVDGRQRSSRGYTMYELARRLRNLGAEDALNLDGGGSSTMVARRLQHRMEVVNSPSDGGQRKVPNGLMVKVRRRR